MKKRLKRLSVLLVAVIMTITTLAVPFTAMAADYQGDLYVIDLPRAADPNKSGWGHPALQFMGGWSMKVSSKDTLYSINDYNGPTCYCIEPGVGLHTGDTVSQKGEDYWDRYPSNHNPTIIPRDIRLLIGRIMQYGWTGNNSVNWTSVNAGADQLAEVMASQRLVWEVIVGERDEEFNKINANTYGCNNIMDTVQPDHPLYNQIWNHYRDIESKVQNHLKRPSFCAKNSNQAQTLEMDYDGEKYTVTIDDSNGVLSNYSFSSSTSGVSFSKNGNSLTISTTQPPVEAISITAEKIESKRRAMVVWSDGVLGPNGGIQDTVTYGATVNDPVQGYLKVKASAGNCQIVKTAEDGFTEGFKFRVTGNGIDRTVTTGSDGTFTLYNIPAGNFKVEEIETENRYVQPSSQTVTVLPGQTAEVHFENKLKRGVAEFKKADMETGKEIETKDGIFGVHEWDNTKNEFSRIEQMTYSEDKAAYTTTKLPVTYKNDGRFKVVEEKAPTGYVRPTNLEYEFVIAQDEEIHKLGENGVIVNAPQKAKIRLNKSDEETAKGIPNAVYPIVADGDVIVNGDVKYKNGQIVDILITGPDGSATSKELYLGKFELFEETAPDGYFNDQTRHKVTLAYQGDTVDVFTSTVSATNRPQKAKIAVTKQGEVLTAFDFIGTEFGVKHTPIYEVQNLPNATYEVSALEDVIVNGDIKYHKGELVDTITTTPDSPAVSKELYLGSYLVKETIAPDGFFIGSNEYEITLSYQGQDVEIFTVPVTSHNERQHMKLNLQKEIEENPYYPNPDAYQDIIFGIYTAEDITAPDGEILIEKDSLVDCFGINSSGQGISVTDLPFAKYYAKELQTATGWVLNTNTYPFEFTMQDQSIPLIWIDLNEDGTEILNETVKGMVEIRKKSSFDKKPLPGGVYGIYRATDNLLIQTLTTQSGGMEFDGWAISDLIPYGRYYIKEITPPDHYHIDPKIYPFFIGEDGEQDIISIEFDLEDEPIIGALTPIYDEKGLKEHLEGLTTPQTGDNSRIDLVLMTMTASGAVVISLMVIKKRKQKYPKKEE